MASRRSSKYVSEIDEFDEELQVAEEELPTYNVSKKVRLQLRISARVTLYGKVTGNKYVWQKAGAIVEVDEEDSGELLAKKLGDRPCCGGNPDNMKLFVKV